MSTASAALRVAQVSFFLDPARRDPEQLLRAWPSLVDVAECAACSGIRVAVIQACVATSTLQRNGVSYHFLPFGRNSGAEDGWEALARLLRDFAPEVLHVHGLGFPQDVLSLAAFAPGTPIILQDHANRVPRRWRRAAWRRAARVISGVAFSAQGQAQPFVTAHVIDPHTRVYEIPESTSRFVPGDPLSARAATQTHGDPLILWVGHLDANKDPLTVLAGVSAATRALPELQLWCCFGTAPLLREVQSRIDCDDRLRSRVHLLGRVPHERIEQLMRAADIFVLGSAREGSGYSLIEALACGLTPVVTDIPSFRVLTGAVGRLWPHGDAGALAEALRECSAATDAGTRAEVRAHFDAQLSFDALGRKLAAMYEDVCARRRGGSVAGSSLRC